MKPPRQSLARPEGIEPPLSGSEAQRDIRYATGAQSQLYNVIRKCTAGTDDPVVSAGHHRMTRDRGLDRL